MRGHPSGGHPRAECGGGSGGGGAGRCGAGRGRGRNLMMLPIPHNPKKIKMLLLICATHRQPITITMTCSICQQKGHNKQTCSVVVRYQYDDCGVRCRINPNDDQDFQPVETYCLPCGSPTLECECGEYKCGKWFNEEKGKFQGAPRRRRQTRFAPIPIWTAPETKEEVATTGKYAGMTAVQIEAIFAERERKNYEELVAPIIAPKLACADCGQVETECRLERLVGGKVMCCDCLDPKPTEEEDDDETVSVVSEDTCECCGKPYDPRNPHRLWELCDCVQNDDGTLSRPEEVPELPCPDCRRWFDEGRERCKSCDYKFDGEEEDSDEDSEGDSESDAETEGECYDGSVWVCCKCEKLSDGKGNPDSTSQFYEELGDWYCGKCHEYYTREDQDDFTNRICEWCHLDFDLADPHYYDEEGNCCYCSEECFKKEQDWLSAPSSTRPPHGSIRTSPTRDQLIALGKYKLAKFQIGKQDQRDETNWNEDGDDELCSAIDASGNALY